PEAGQRRDRPTTQFAPVRPLPVRLLPIRLNRHHGLLMSQSTGGFSATVCHLGGAAALAVNGSSATTAPAGRHATRPLAPGPQDHGGVWRPAPTSPWRTQHVPPQRYRRGLTAPRPRRALNQPASSVAHPTLSAPALR